MDRIFVLGAGSIGCLVAGYLRNAGLPVTLLMRSHQQMQRFIDAQHTITIERSNTIRSRTLSLQCHAEVAADASTIPIQNLVVATKAQHTVAALQAIHKRLLPSSSILLLQNGVLGVLQSISEHLCYPGQQFPLVLVGSVTHGCYQQSPFHIVHAGVGKIDAGIAPIEWLESSLCNNDKPDQAPPSKAFGHAPATPALNHQQLQCGAIHAPQSSGHSSVPVIPNAIRTLQSAPELHIAYLEQPKDLQRLLLLKLAANCSINPLTAIHGCSNGALTSSPAAMGLIGHVCSEMADALTAKEGITREQLVESVVHVMKMTSNNRSSMLQDITQGKRTEIDFLTGYLVSCAHRAGVETPVNNTLLALVKIKEQLAIST